MYLTRKFKNKKYVKRRRSIRRRTSQRGRGGEEQCHRSTAGVVDPPVHHRVSHVVRDDRDVTVRVYGDYFLDVWQHLDKKFIIAPDQTIGYLKQQIENFIKTKIPDSTTFVPYIDSDYYTHSSRQRILPDEMTIRQVRDTYHFHDNKCKINVRMIAR